MFSVQPSKLTDKELVRYADSMLAEGKLPVEWQEEIIKRLEDLVNPALRHDGR
jgi:hypothetical protein